MAKWEKELLPRGGFFWRLIGTTFEVQKSFDRYWDISEKGDYLCSARTVVAAKKICQRLAKSDA